MRRNSIEHLENVGHSPMADSLAFFKLRQANALLQRGFFLCCLLLGSILGIEIKGEEPKTDTLTVEELVKNPSVYKGEIEIVGVVSKVYPKDSAFRIVSLKEFKECGIICEDASSIPVIYKGKLPKIKDEVWIKGVIEKVKKKGVLLKAKKVKVN